MFDQLIKHEPPDLMKAIHGNPVNLRDIERLIEQKIKAETIKHLVRQLNGVGYSINGQGPAQKYIFDESGSIALVAMIKSHIAKKNPS